MESYNETASTNKLSIFRYLFQSCWDVFLPYLSNLEIGKLDLILTDISLRKLYFSLVNEFYLTNKIYDFKELDWILNKHVSLTKCHLEFKFKGKYFYYYIKAFIRCASYLYSAADAELTVFSRIAKVFPNLIEISGENIDEEGLRALGRLNGSCLSSVTFDYINNENKNSRLDNAIETLCKGSPNLKKLILNTVCFSVNLTDAAVRSIIQHCPNIEVLSLNNWRDITDFSMLFLSQLSSLRSIDLSQCFDLSSVAVQRLLQAHRKLEVLILSEVSRTEDHGDTDCLIDDELLRCISMNCSNLIKLHMHFDSDADYSGITTASFEALLMGLPALTDILLVDLDNTNASVLPLFGIYCPLLKNVHIDNVPCSDEEFVSMCRGCALIESLEMNYLEKITDISILAISRHCTSLKHIAITYSVHFTDDTLCILSLSFHIVYTYYQYH